MKAVILLAGKGRRIQAEYGGMHKTLIPLNGNPIIYYILDNIARAGYTEIVPIVGYNGNTVLKAIEEAKTVFPNVSRLKVTPCFNDEYDHTNNLYSLLQSESITKGEDFVVVNGDMVFDYRILKDIRTMSPDLEVKNGGLSDEKEEENITAIATDNTDYGYQIDSPRILIQNDRIMDIGRHRTIEESNGYAVGIYRFGKDIHNAYFNKARDIVKEKLEAGYHEPLIQLFDQYDVLPSYTKQYEWMDVDEKKDVQNAEAMLDRIHILQKIK